MSIATCPTCGAAWNVAGLVGVPAISCQRCGGVVPLASAAPSPVVDAAWAGGAGALSGEGILAMPAAAGTPVGENAVPCAHCGTVLDAAGLAVGMMLRCGRCGGVFARPHASQIAAAYGQAPPPAGAPSPVSLAAPAAAPPKPSESSGEFELSLKETVKCPGCGREFYEEELPPPDEDRKIRCKRCKKVIRDLSIDDSVGEEEEGEGDDPGSSKERRRTGAPAKRGPGGPRKGAVARKPAGPEKVILDEKFKAEVFGYLRQGDEARALERCQQLVSGRDSQARQIYEHLHGIAKKKGWLGAARPAARPGSTPPAPMPARPTNRLGLSSQGFAPPPAVAPGISNAGFAPPATVAPGTSNPGFAPPPAAYGHAPPPGYAPSRPGAAPVYAAPGSPASFAPPAAPGYAPSPGAPAFSAPSNAPGLVAEPAGIPEGLELLPETPVFEATHAPAASAPPAPAPAPRPPAEQDPPEEGFLARVAREGRVAQLEVLVGARRFAAARDLARAILAREPRTARALTLLAEALAALGDDEGALDAASKGARLEPDAARAVRVYAQALAQKGKLVEAANVIRRVVGPRKGEAADAVFLADLLRRQGDEAGARRIMEEVVARDPQSVEPLRQAAHARTAARDYEAAAAELERLFEKEKAPRPMSLAIAVELAQALEAAGAQAPPRAVVTCAKALDGCGKTIAAVRLLGPLVQRDPNATDARRALGLAYARLGAAPLAEEHLRAVAGRGGAGADELRALGELALERGDAEGAARVLLRARELRPDDVPVRRALARAYEAAGELQKALEEIEGACAAKPHDRELEAAQESLATRALAARTSALEARVREAPDDAQAHLDLGTALFEKGDATRALEELGRAARDPYLLPRAVDVLEFVQDELDDPRPAVVLLLELHVKAHDVPRAIQVLEAFLKDRPEDPLRLELLELYAEGHRVAAAVEGLLALLPRVEAARLPAVLALADRILEREPLSHDLGLKVAHARRRIGDLEGAARAFERYLEGEPGDREARLELARTLEDAGKLEPARAALERLTGDGEAQPEELSHAAALLSRLDRHEAALPLLRRALEKRPDDRSLKERLERAEAAVRDREAARLADEVRAGRASEDDRRRLAALYAEAGKRDETLELLRALPGTPAGEPEAVFLRFAAEQHARRGKIEKAEAALRQLCSVLAYAAGSEQEKAMLYRIAALYERASDRRSARRLYLELVARDPSYRDAYARLEAGEDASAAAIEPEAGSERAFVEFLETEAPRDLKTIFESLGQLDLALDARLLAEARAAQSAMASTTDDE